MSVYRTIGPLVNFVLGIDCGHMFELPLEGSSNMYPESMFWNNEKISETYEPRHEKTGFSHMREQRRRSASQ